MHKALLLLLGVAAIQAATGTPFRPWGDTRYRIVNAIEFMPDGKTMIAALFPADVARVQGAAPTAPEVALYESRREGDAWSAPVLLPFAGTHKDYEAAIAPDGTFIIFNSQRPLPDGTRVPEGKNNLWLVRRTAAGWATPSYLSGVNLVDTEESYASITRDGRVVYVQEAGADAHGRDWNIHITRLAGDDVERSMPFAPAATSAGEGDPWIAPDGSYLIFTRWDRAKTWAADTDLYITFHRASSWSAPVAVTELNAPGAPDYAVSIAGTPPVIYWKSRGETLHAAWDPILAAVRARAAGPHQPGSGPTTITDGRDGRTYPVIEIAGMAWLGRNLAYAADGSVCPRGDESACSTDGRLYPWRVAMTACPSGWHLSTEEEWQRLERALGMAPDDLTRDRQRGPGLGDMLKPGGATGLNIPFAGWRRPDGSFSAGNGNDRAAALWTATAAKEGTAWHRDLSSARTGIWRSPVDYPYSLSVRCVKD